MSRPDQCWTMTQFADPESVPTSVYDPSSQPPSPKPPPPIPKPPPPSPSARPPPPSPPPPPPTPSCFNDAPPGSHWCGVTHPGQQSYDANSGAAIASTAGGNWRQNPNFGWHFCGLTEEECKDACLEMGSCAELLIVAANGCCFPARSVCDGNKRPNDEKLVVGACTTIPPPPLPPPSSSFPTNGIKVLSGAASDTTALECVTDPTQTTVGSGNQYMYSTIAAQCCEMNGVCRRYIGKNNDDGCVAGHSNQVSPPGAITATTYSEAYEMCSALGLQLCDKSCRGQGCHYNSHPVSASSCCTPAPRRSSRGIPMLQALLA